MIWLWDVLRCLCVCFLSSLIFLATHYLFAFSPHILLSSFPVSMFIVYQYLPALPPLSSLITISITGDSYFFFSYLSFSRHVFDASYNGCCNSLPLTPCHIHILSNSPQFFSFLSSSTYAPLHFLLSRFFLSFS